MKQREVKFRGYNKDHNRMYKIMKLSFDEKGDIIHLVVDNGINVAPRYSNYYKDHDEWDISCIEIMQYTGLKDRYGKEIYEGDLVRRNRFSGYIVEFQDGAFVLRIIEYPNTIKPLTINDLKTLEVYGNIHEHKQLK